MRVTIPTAQGGLNLIDKLDQMGIEYSFQLDNIIPEETSDRVRNGSEKLSERATQTLIGFNVVPNEAVLGADSESIYEIDLGDGTTTDLNTGFTSSDWIQAFFTDGSGSGNVFVCNGSDTPQRIYNDGTLKCEDFTFTVPTGSGSGLDLDDLNYTLNFKNRMYFVEKETFNLYYGDVQAISGELTQFSVAGFVKGGGSISAIANWTQDAGTGVSNLLTIFTTEGEVLVYQGTSPEAADWALVGNYRISRPIGNRFLENLGGDLVVITEQGYLPLSVVLNQDRANRVQISDKINPIVKGKSTTLNWSIHWYSKEGWLLVSAPSSTSRYKYEQHIYNTQTGAWCRFVGMDGWNWLAQGDRLLFCNNAGVYEANVGTSDDGKAITYVNQRAYSKLNGEKVKQPLRVTPNYQSLGGTLDSNVRYGIDFKIGVKQQLLNQGSGNSSFWDESIWDESFWSDENLVERFKSTTYSNTGEYISLGLFGETSTDLEFYSIELLYRGGNGDI